jgi:uncharacterized membrane protein YgcG
VALFGTRGVIDKDLISIKLPNDARSPGSAATSYAGSVGECDALPDDPADSMNAAQLANLLGFVVPDWIPESEDTSAPPPLDAPATDSAWPRMPPPPAPLSASQLAVNEQVAEQLEVFRKAMEVAAVAQETKLAVMHTELAGFRNLARDNANLARENADLKEQLERLKLTQPDPSLLAAGGLAVSVLTAGAPLASVLPAGALVTGVLTAGALAADATVAGALPDDVPAGVLVAPAPSAPSLTTHAPNALADSALADSTLTGSVPAGSAPVAGALPAGARTDGAPALDEIADGALVIDTPAPAALGPAAPDTPGKRLAPSSTSSNSGDGLAQDFGGSDGGGGNDKGGSSKGGKGKGGKGKGKGGSSKKKGKSQ